MHEVASEDRPEHELLRRLKVARAFRQVARWCWDDDAGDPDPLPAESPRLRFALWGKRGRPHDFWARKKAMRLWADRAEKVGTECGTRFEQVPNFHCAACDNVWNTAPMGCSLRYCPGCVKHVRRRAVERVERILETFRRPRFATFTMRSMHDLRHMLERLVGAWDKLRRRKSWRNFVRGAVWALEVTWSREHGWHAHLHVVWDGLYIPRDELAADWLELTGGDGQQVWLVKCTDAKSAARELAKYVGKDLGWGKGFAAVPERLAEFLACMWNFKAIRTYGTARKVPKDDRELACPACGELHPEYLGSCAVYALDRFQGQFRSDLARRQRWRNLA